MYLLSEHGDEDESGDKTCLAPRRTARRTVVASALVVAACSRDALVAHGGWSCCTTTLFVVSRARRAKKLEGPRRTVLDARCFLHLEMTVLTLPTVERATGSILKTSPPAALLGYDVVATHGGG